ncbi:hypothetical protein ABXZ88_003200 [Vibrio fluvialis]
MPQTQKDLIEHFETQFKKTVESHGLTSEYATNAFFNLQAAKMGKPLKEIYQWSLAETDRLHKITLDSLPASRSESSD